jgi:hypothetical protein
MVKDARSIIEGNAAEQGWSQDSQIAILLDYIDELNADIPHVHGHFEAYLDVRCDDENSPSKDN